MSIAASNQKLEELLLAFSSKVSSLVRRHRLYRYGLDSQDVEQEVYIRLWRAIERDVEMNSAYICRVVVSTVIDAIRASRKVFSDQEADCTEDDETTIADTAMTPEDRISAVQLIELCGRHAQLLSKRRRSVLKMYLCGFSLRQIADAVGTSVDAARKLVARTLGELRASLSAMERT